MGKVEEYRLPCSKFVRWDLRRDYIVSLTGSISIEGIGENPAFFLTI